MLRELQELSFRASTKVQNNAAAALLLMGRFKETFQHRFFRQLVLTGFLHTTELYVVIAASVLQSVPAQVNHPMRVFVALLFRLVFIGKLFEELSLDDNKECLSGKRPTWFFHQSIQLQQSDRHHSAMGFKGCSPTPSTKGSWLRQRKTRSHSLQSLKWRFASSEEFYSGTR